MSMPENPYSSPYGGYGYESTPQAPQQKLADLGKRFLGALVDGIAGVAAIGPGYGLLIAAGAMDDGRNRGEMPEQAIMGLVLLVIGAVILLGVQIYLVATRSQSIGKFVMNTQIVDYNTRQPADFVHAFLLRSFVNGIIGGLPCIGPIYSLADILFIFGQDYRCLHDKLANTVVIDLSA